MESILLNCALKHTQYYDAETERPIDKAGVRVRREYPHPYHHFLKFNISHSPLSGLNNPILITFHTIHSDR
ncbi:hypothetical protein C5471_19925 [Photorhabdus tasmaniensis]|uniref:Uncharacterized protein n=1 Tax=Photorhabdus tasmaniensis TaxID=1004159 RepID=A0ABX0GNW5_9GAMM|nr:hypothetical protein [Photorhabdus tasmaniensis]